MKIEITHDDIMRRCSGAFLTECLPENWRQMDEAALDKFLIDHAWEPFQYHTADQIYEFIDNEAFCWMLFLKERGIEVLT